MKIDLTEKEVYLMGDALISHRWKIEKQAGEQDPNFQLCAQLADRLACNHTGAQLTFKSTDGTIPLSKKEAEILRLIERFTGFEKTHHKAYLIDQIARLLLAEKYDDWVLEMKNGDDGPATYDYDTGIAP